MIFPVLPEKRERVIPVDSQNKLLYNLKKTRELSENGRKEEVIHGILTEKTVDVKAEVQDWEEAVRAAGELLYDNGDVEACYIDNMINIVKEVGPYIVLLKGVALAHARPEQGAKKIGLPLLTLKTPVYFGNPENDPVSLVFALSAVDSSSHIDLLSELSEIFNDERGMERLTECKSKKELLNMIDNIVEKRPFYK